MNHTPEEPQQKSQAITVPLSWKGSAVSHIMKFVAGLPSLPALFVHKIFVINFLSGFILTGIVLVGLDIRQNMAELHAAQARRMEVRNELLYWQGFARQHTDYRDAYLKLATLEYQLGNSDMAKSYIQKALDIDPHSSIGRDLLREMES